MRVWHSAGYEVLMHFKIRINGIHALNQRYEAYKGFTGHEPGIKPIKALPGYECRVAFTGDCLLVLMRLFFYELGFCLKLSEKSETLWKSGMNLTEIVQTIVLLAFTIKGFNHFNGCG